MWENLFNVAFNRFNEIDVDDSLRSIWLTVGSREQCWDVRASKTCRGDRYRNLVSKLGC